MRNSELVLFRKFTENTKFRTGGFYIRPLKIPYFRQILRRGRVSRPTGMTFLVAEYLMGFCCAEMGGYVIRSYYSVNSKSLQLYWFVFK